MRCNPRLATLIGAAVVILAGLPLATAGGPGRDLLVPLPELPPPIAVVSDSPEQLPPLERAKTYEDEVVEIVNQERWSNGQLPPLARCALLDTSSETHSSNMAVRDFLAHCDLDTGTEFWERIIAAGYSFNAAAENIAAGQSTAAQVMTAWMNSEGHRANILDLDFREIGVGWVYQSGDQANVRLDQEPPQDPDCIADDISGPFGHYWTQNFGRRDIVYPVIIDREAYETATRAVDLYLYGTGWAQEMRIKNDTGSWSSWQTFQSDVAWQLSTGDGTKQVFVEIRNGSTVRAASDTIECSGCGAASPEIFADGFETGDTSHWSEVVP